MGTKADEGSQKTPIGGKLNYIKQATIGKKGGEEFKYPLRFSEEMQTGPTRVTLESTSNISEKAGQGLQKVKDKFNEAIGRTEDKTTIR